MDPVTRKLVETVLQITENTSDANTGGFVKVLPQNKDKPEINHTLHVNNGQHYVVSSNPNETLVFPADKNGNITSYTEVHAGDTPNFDSKNFNVRDHHTATFQEFTTATGSGNTSNQNTQTENFDLMSGLGTIAPTAVVAGAAAVPLLLPGIIDRIRDAQKKPVTSTTPSARSTPTGKPASLEQLDTVNQSTSAREHLEGIEAKKARSEGRRPNPVSDADVARLVQSRVAAASGVMTRRENIRNPPAERGNDGY